MQNIVNSKNLLLFDLCVGGHHPSYIQHLVQYWCEQQLSDNIYIVVSPQFINIHADVVKIALNSNQNNVRFVSITEDEYKRWQNQKNSLLKVFQEWHIFCQYSKKLQIGHCLFLYFDHFQLPLALGARSPCEFSGIYFRPTFHYYDFHNYVPSFKERLRQWRQKLILGYVLKNQQLKTLFSLDPFAVEHIKKLSDRVKIIHLPDPVQMNSHQETKSKVCFQKEALGIEPDKKIFLLFGRLDARKGIHQLLEAILLLPPDICKKLCLLLIGEIPAAEKMMIEGRLAKISNSLPIQIVSRYEFVSEQEMHLYFQIADIVLAPYQHHVGMSGVLLQAAAAKKPVLASNYGLLGNLVLLHQLGITVDSTSPQAIVEGIIKFTCKFDESFYNVTSMDNFVKQYDKEKFSQTLLTNLL